MNKGFERKIIMTSDGSHSLKLVNQNEHYHSTFGAIQESRHIFIEQGLLSISPIETPLHILEVGFGTGLNALLTLLETQKSNFSVYYNTLEPYPLAEKEYRMLNYPEILGPNQLLDCFRKLHQCEWGKDIEINPGFIFHKARLRLEDASFPETFFDLVYYDAFGPAIQPELWGEASFGKMFRAIRPGGLLVTYSAKGAVRRTLKSFSFSVEKLAGPPGKREMIRAKKMPEE